MTTHSIPKDVFLEKNETPNEAIDWQKLLLKNWQTINTKITQSCKQHHRVNDAVNLIAVSKTKPIEMIWTLAEAGQCHFGENYLQEALQKIESTAKFTEETGHKISWHYIGAIQRNKTRDIAKNFQWVHTIDRLIIAERLNNQRPNDLPKLNILLQVNIDDEDSKAGCTSEELPLLIQNIMLLSNLQLRGLMVIPAKNNSDSLNRTKALFETIKIDNPSLMHWDTLSMGMSADLDEAIQQGSTMVRVGTAIFGTRNQ